MIATVVISLCSAVLAWRVGRRIDKATAKVDRIVEALDANRGA